MSETGPIKDGDKWVVNRDKDEISRYLADITQELIDRATTATSVVLILAGVEQVEEPTIEVVTLEGVQRTYVVALLGPADGPVPADWRWVARVTCANGERFDKTTWFNEVDP